MKRGGRCSTHRLFSLGKDPWVPFGSLLTFTKGSRNTTLLRLISLILLVRLHFCSFLVFPFFYIVIVFLVKFVSSRQLSRRCSSVDEVFLNFRWVLFPLFLSQMRLFVHQVSFVSFTIVDVKHIVSVAS